MCHTSSNTGPTGGLGERPAGSAGNTFRLLTLNLGLLALNLKGWLRVPIDIGLQQRLAAAPELLSAVDADIVALQEVYTQADRHFLTQSLAPRYPFMTGAPNSYSPVGSGLMLLSRFPILRSEFIPCRGSPWWMQRFWRQGFLKAEIDLPHAGRINLINVHLAAAVPFARSDSFASLANRAREIVQLLEAARFTELPTILIGDFNTSPEIYPEGYRRILEAGYIDAFAASERKNDGVTWDAENPLNQRGRFRHSPSQRIDHVFVTNARSPMLSPISAQIVLRERVLRTPEGNAIPLSDHYGMLATVAASVPLSFRISHGVAETGGPP